MPRCTHNRFGDTWSFLWEDLGLTAVVDIVADGARRGGVHAEVVFGSAIRGGHILQREVNLLASRTRNDIVKELVRRTGADLGDCDDVMEQLTKIVVAEHRTPPAGVQADDVPAHDGEVFLDNRGILPEGDITYFYGPRESAKSFIAMGLSLALHHGVPLGPIAPLRSGLRVLWLSWEQRDPAIAATFRAVKAGMGIIDRSWLQIHEMDRPLADCARWLRAEVARDKIDLVVADSYIPAAGPDPETNDSASRLFRALRSLGPRTTELVISHVAKSDIDNHKAEAFGAVTNMNLTRSAWLFSRGEDETIAHRAFPVGLYQTKNSYGRRAQFGLRLDIHGEPGRFADRVEFTSTSLMDDPDLAEKAGLRLLIEAYLSTRKTALTVKEIAEGIGHRADSVKRTLLRMKTVSRADSQGKESRWGLKAWTDDHGAH